MRWRSVRTAGLWCPRSTEELADAGLRRTFGVAADIRPSVHMLRTILMGSLVFLFDATAAGQSPAGAPRSADSLVAPEVYWRIHREQRDFRRKDADARRLERDRLLRERLAAHRARQDSINPWSVPAHSSLEGAGGALIPANFSYPVGGQATTAHVERPGASFRLGFVDWSASKGQRAHVGFGIRIGYARYSDAPVHANISGNVSVSNYSGWWRQFDGEAVLVQRSIGLRFLVGSRPSARSLLFAGAEMRFSESRIEESGETVYSQMVQPDPYHPNGHMVTTPAEHYRYDRSSTWIRPIQLALQFGYQYRFGRRLLAGLEGEVCAIRLSKATDDSGRLLKLGGRVAGLFVSVGLDLDR